MLYVIHGEDEVQIRDRTKAILDTLRSKRKDADVCYLNEEDDEGQAERLAVARSLFDDKYIVVVSKKVNTDLLKLFSDSPHIFLLRDFKPDKKTVTAYKKYAKKVEECKATKKETFNTFTLADALLKKDRKALWVGFQNAVGNGVSVEEIHGVLLWQVDVIRRAFLAKTASEVKMKPFVFTKAKRATTNFTQEELDTLAKDLAECSLKARRGEFNFEDRLEQIITSI
ncbi:MAG: hypothetical protein OXU73_00085 [Candidatus Campbellbacteria bacterium]|nr:hypothetical protein [Candidatus Campbellbacteria bacterium]